MPHPLDGVNLVPNYSAEDTPFQSSNSDPIPSWSTVNAGYWTDFNRNIPAILPAGLTIPHGGRYFVSVRYDGTTHPTELTPEIQSDEVNVDVSGSGAQIDAGGIGYSYSAWIGTPNSHSPVAKFTAEFLDSSHALISSVDTGFQQSAAAHWSQFTGSGAAGTVPSGTRYIRFKN